MIYSGHMTTGFFCFFPSPFFQSWCAQPAAPDATCRTSALRLLASLVLVSNTFPVLPTRVSNIAPSTPWNAQTNALEGGDATPRFCVTHPYHPVFQHRFELLARGTEWGEDRVYHRDEDGRKRFLPARWTSLAPSDPFVITVAGRAYFRLEDLIRLADRTKEEWKG